MERWKDRKRGGEVERKGFQDKVSTMAANFCSKNSSQYFRSKPADFAIARQVMWQETVHGPGQWTSPRRLLETRSRVPKLVSLPGPGSYTPRGDNIGEGYLREARGWRMGSESARSCATTP